MRKQVRSISGITPLAVMLKPYPCPHKGCIYCPSQENVPKSYTKTSPVVLRASACEYDPFKQIRARLKILKLMGHNPEKIELIVMGGTFSAYPEDYQEQFIKGCFDGMNNSVSKNLQCAQKINETTQHRCVAMCLETRPDYCKQEHINNFLKFGATRVEIGVQTLDDKIQKFTNRGHTTRDVIQATKLLKNSAYKTGHHYMLGLPNSNPEKDLEMFKEVFSNPDFQPDQIKIYPTFVIKGTKLEDLYKSGDYTPYTTEQIVDLLVKIKQIIPPYVRIMRVMRDIPKEYIASECFYSHLRDAVAKKMQQENKKCSCIRCREVSHIQRKTGITSDLENIKLCRINYNASNGKEIFLSYEDVKKNILIGLLRLRIPNNPFRPEITNKTSLLREVHIYSKQLAIGAKPDKDDWQHKGYGTKLVKEAERISKEEYDCKKMIVISGVGVRRYFINEHGYNYDGPYVSKKI